MLNVITPIYVRSANQGLVSLPKATTRHFVSRVRAINTFIKPSVSLVALAAKSAQMPQSVRSAEPLCSVMDKAAVKKHARRGNSKTGQSATSATKAVRPARTLKIAPHVKLD